MLHKIFFIGTVGVCALFFLWGVELARAQIADLSLLGNPIVLEASPSTPQPNTEVTLTAKSYSLDLNRMTLSWFVDGELVLEGKGRDTLTTNVGGSGSKTEVRVVVRNSAGTSWENRLVLRPASVDILWQASSYTPPFYRGKALLGPNSTLTIVAIPHVRTAGGLLIKPENLTFTWKRGYKVLGSQSGRGRDTITLKGDPLLKPLDIRVEVASDDGGVVAYSAVYIPSITPRLVLYENHPTLGLYLEEAVGSDFTMNNEEATLVAVPYFFDTALRGAEGLEYEWSVNNNTVSNPSRDMSVITLRPQSSSSGSSRVRVSLDHTRHILQQASTQTTVHFSNQTAASAPF